MNSYGAPYWLENCRMSKFSGLPGRMSEEIPVYVSLYHPSWLSFWPYYYLEGNKQKIANFKVKYSGDTKNVHVLWSQINLFHFCCCEVASVASDSVRHHRWQPTRLPHPWDPPGKNTGVGCHFLLQCMKVRSESGVTQLCPTPSNPMDCSLPGSSVHGIFQARVLEWVAIALSEPTSLEINNEKIGYGSL